MLTSKFYLLFDFEINLYMQILQSWFIIRGPFQYYYYYDG